MSGQRPGRDPAPDARSGDGPRLLAGGNPQIAKGEGDGPVQRYIAAMPTWKRDVGARLDELIEAAVPDVRKAVKWNQPLYGADDDGWFASFRCFTEYVQLTLFRGASLHPVPPTASKQPDVRSLDIHEHDDLDEATLTAWFEHAGHLPGTKL